MIQRLAALAGRSNQDPQVFLNLILPDQVGELLRAEGVIDAVVRLGFGVKRTRFGHGEIIAN
ncbi:MAG TPA: hypothetical protein VI524_10625 [Anaerolineales bacterium]|nr:hypothetical protein [Anaerolineales bacterium]